MSLIKRMGGTPAADEESAAEETDSQKAATPRRSAASSAAFSSLSGSLSTGGPNTEVVLGSAGTSPLPRNTVLQSRYDREQVLGIGGMSSVYRARRLRCSTVARYCAIKEIPDTSPDPRTGQIRLANF